MDGLTLMMFAEGAAAAGATGAGAAGATGADAADAAVKPGKADLSAVVYGKEAEAPKAEEAQSDAQPDVKREGEAPDRAAQFEKRIRGEDKDLFDARVQAIIDQRFKETKALQERTAKLNPALELLSKKYGIDATDADKLAAAIESDDSYFEDEAVQRGMTVKELKEVKALERENAKLRAAETERVNAEKIAGYKAEIDKQVRTTAQLYPGFDFDQERMNPGFDRLLRAGVDVKTAYEVTHKDEIVGGAMRYAAAEVQKKTVDDIRARGQRPAENGLGAQAPSLVRKADVNSFTREDRDEIARRAARGERIVL